MNKTEAFQKSRARRVSFSPKLVYPAELPIIEKKDEIISAIRRHPVVIITGETGSGKTTQIPKMCIEAGRGLAGRIGCTQPRRIAAISVAGRIAEEMGEELGRSVGYKIRFDDRAAPSAVIKVMTDGILLMEAQRDRLLRAYDTIIVDEAHERSLNIDFVLGILKNILPARNDLRVVITSATIDAEKFSAAFEKAPIIEVSGRVYPVLVRYAPIEQNLDQEKEEATYIDATIKTVEDLIRKREPGDILVFMPTEQDIRETSEALRGRLAEEAVILPLFARLSRQEQQFVFQRMAQRKIIVATNIAETSLTIPGIRYVVDTGLARISVYNPRSSTAALPIRSISRSSADQRKGRCGRVASGVCIRLYSEEDYLSRPLYTPPEILRANLAGVILRMLSLGLGDIDSFPFIDKPVPKGIKEGLETLQELGAIDQGGSGRRLTKTGLLMARLPLDPRISRMIIEAKKEDCLREIIIIAAALSIQDPRERPSEKEAEADRAHAVFKDPASDFISLLTMYNSIYPQEGQQKSQGQIRRFCREHFLSYRRIREWNDIREQIYTILKEYRFIPDHQWRKTKNQSEPQGNSPETHQKSGAEIYAAVHRSILSGFLSHIAVKKEKNLYTATKGREVIIYPGSGLFKHAGNWIVAAEIVETSRLFARIAANIESAWLEELGGNLCRYGYFTPHWEKKRGEVVASERVTLFGLVIVPGRNVSYGRIDPVEASRIFIRSALVEGDMQVPLPFLLHNQELIEKATQMEEKLRRRDLVVGEEEVALFYEQRLAGVFDVRTLQKIIRDRGDDFLRMKEDDILAKEADPEEVALYPDSAQVSGWSLDCVYRFAPGNEEDGVTVRIPVHSAASLPVASLDWSIPGLLREKIAAMLRSLPKEYRKKLMPLVKTTDVVLHEMPRSGRLATTLRRFLYERFNMDIPSDIPFGENIEERLRLRFQIVDQKGCQLAAGRDESLLRADVTDTEGNAIFEDARRKLEKTGFTSWSFGDIPQNIPYAKKGAGAFVFYPALQAEGNTVAYRIFKTAREAELVHPSGVKALFGFKFSRELHDLQKALLPTGDLKVWSAAFGGAKNLQSALYEKALHDLFELDIRTAKDFELHAEKTRQTIMTKGQETIKIATPVMKALYEAADGLRISERANSSNRPFLAFLEGLRDELAVLVPRDFLIRYDEQRLNHIPRYIKAIAIRAQRGAVDLGKAVARGNEVRELFNILDEFKKTAEADTEERTRLLEEIRWMIEEYKVSVFAQELKTPYPVSRKRLYAKIDEMKRYAV